MKKIFFLVTLSLTVSALYAQNDDAVQIEEVTVEASSVTKTVDGMQLIPTSSQLQHSASGYDLLARIGLPDLRIDIATNTISTFDGKGEVQIRINDIVASRQDMQALDVKNVIRIDYIEHPGVRYGDNIVRVVNFVVRRATSGYIVGTQLKQQLAKKNGSGNVFLKYNRGQNEFHFMYAYTHSDLDGTTKEKVSDFHLTDNSVITKTELTHYMREKNRSHNLTLRHSLADSAGFVLQTTLNGVFSRGPFDHRESEVSLANTLTRGTRETNEASDMLSLNVYLHKQLTEKQLFTVNLTGTYIHSDYAYNYAEGDDLYQYSVAGKSWSAMGEAIYENKLKPFTWSVGMNFQQKYLSNQYVGDAQTTTAERTSNVYFFTQINGKLARINYMAGLGVNRYYYRQGKNQLDYTLLRPELTVSVPLWKTFRLRYVVEMMQSVPRPSWMGDVAVRLNQYEMNVGNPYLRGNKRLNQELSLSHQSARFYADLLVAYPINRHSSTRSVTRTADDVFVFSYAELPKCNLFYVQQSGRWRIIPEKLDFNWSGGVYRFFNYGTDYKHHFTSFYCSAWASAYLGKFSLIAYADNGWRGLEGEIRYKNGTTVYAGGSYRLKHGSVSLFVQQPFQKNPLTARSELLNRFVQQRSENHSTDYGNVIILKFTWQLSHGREYKQIQRSQQQQDRETGIMKAL